MRRPKFVDGLWNGRALKTRSLEHALQISSEGPTTKVQRSTPSAQPSQSVWSHVRRCHKCGHITEATGERVLSCASCATHFAPFFFAELTPEAIVAEGLKDHNSKKDHTADDTTLVNRAAPTSLALSTARNYRAVVGLTWWWSDAD